MKTTICRACNGSGRVTNYSKKRMVSSSTFSYEQELCLRCNGKGTIDPNPEFRTTKKNTKRKDTTPLPKTSNQKSNSKEIITLVVFVSVSIFFYYRFQENWLFAALVGFVAAIITYWLFKLIIFLFFAFLIYSLYKL